MKRIIYFTALLLLAFAACKRMEPVTEPDFDVQVEEFDVQTESVEVNVGEEVVFSFSGDPDFINFYSGERGNDYAYREGRVEDAEILLSFQSSITTNRESDQDDQLSVQISQNFDGEFNIEAVEAADWTDITQEFTVVSHADVSGTQSGWIGSGKANISPYIEEGKPLYIAFRYVAMPRSTHGLTPNFLRVRNFLLESIDDEGGTSTIAEQSTAGLVPPKALVESETYRPNRGSVTAAQINFISNQSPAFDDVEHSAWAITDLFEIQKAMDLGPDKAVSIKTVADITPPSYTHTYTKEGKYTAVFIAKNANVNDEQTVMKTIEINVVPLSQ